MSTCANCGREIKCGGLFAGPFLFCSPLCLDTSEELKRYEQTKSASARCRLCDKRLPSGLSWNGAQGPNWYCSKECQVRFLGIDSSTLEGEAQCFPGCFICGAMRERSGGGNS